MDTRCFPPERGLAAGVAHGEWPAGFPWGPVTWRRIRMEECRPFPPVRLAESRRSTLHAVFFRQLRPVGWVVAVRAGSADLSEPEGTMNEPTVSRGSIWGGQHASEE